MSFYIIRYAGVAWVKVRTHPGRQSLLNWLSYKDQFYGKLWKTTQILFLAERIT